MSSRESFAALPIPLSSTTAPILPATENEMLVWNPQSEPEWPTRTVSPFRVPYQPRPWASVQSGSMTQVGRCISTRVRPASTWPSPRSAAGSARSCWPSHAPRSAAVLHRPPSARKSDRVQVARPAGRVVVAAGVVADGPARRPVRVPLGVEDRVGHPQRIQDGRADVRDEVRPGEALHQEPQELEGEVAVLVACLRHGPHGTQVEDVGELVRAVHPEPLRVLPREPRPGGRTYASGAGGSSGPRSSRGGSRVARSSGRNRTAGSSRPEPTLVAQLEDGRRRDRLGDRGDPVQRALVRPPAALEVREAAGVPPAQAVAGRDPGHDAGEPVLAPDRRRSSPGAPVQPTR